ncbi:MAG TPA: ankyrin repeat domain-containing protein [Steroidobacteraceae bacterium]|nr:ankyrin repeat domain-containing protein [Steroidobacteraceae bacterium]
MKSVSALRTALLLLPLLLATRPAAAGANEDLLRAARAGDTAQLALALMHGADANAAGEQGISALMYAAASGHPEAVQQLLDAHARLDTRAGRIGVTALRIAVAAGSADAARVLLAAGADRNETDANGSRLLFAAAGNGRPELLELFLVPGEDVNYKRKAGGYTALDAALESQHWTAAEYLLAHGATLAASVTGREQALPRLLELEPVVKPGTLSLVQTVDLPSPALFRAVLAQGARTDITDEQGNTLLMLAARHHHVTALAALLGAGLDANARNAAGDTALAIAAGKSEYELMVVGIGLALSQDQTSVSRLVFRPAQNSSESAATARRLEAARLLLGAMADPNAADRGGDTPLHQATRTGDAELVALLLSAGARVNARDAAGSTPLLLAARYGLQDIVVTLLAARADPAITDGDGHTALELAQAGHHDAVARLLAPRLN